MFTTRNNQDTSYNNQTNPKFQYPIIKQYKYISFGYLNLVIGYCLYLVSWLLVISSNIRI